MLNSSKNIVTSSVSLFRAVRYGRGSSAAQWLTIIKATVLATSIPLSKHFLAEALTLLCIFGQPVFQVGVERLQELGEGLRELVVQTHQWNRGEVRSLAIPEYHSYLGYAFEQGSQSGVVKLRYIELQAVDIDGNSGVPVVSLLHLFGGVFAR